MRSALLHLDEALTSQYRLRQAVCNAGGRLLDYRDLGPALRLWSRPSALERLRRRLAAALPTALGPMLVFSGSGDFHHVTLLLLERALAASNGDPATLIHFDNHPDWVKFRAGAHCGSWVGQAARMPGIAKVITVGVCSADLERPGDKAADLSIVTAGKLDLYPYHAAGSVDRIRLCGREWPTIEGMGEAAFAEFLPRQIDTPAIYITVDKDVLRSQDAGTNWDQGRTSLAFLKALIGQISQGRLLIGADIVGDWSEAVYGGGLLASLVKRAEAILDQPWRAPSAELRALNEDVNLELLTLLQDLAI